MSWLRRSWVQQYEIPEDVLRTYPPAGPIVDGRAVRPFVPNQSSIAASLEHYELLPGIREVPMAAFTLDAAPLSRDVRTVELARQIRESGEISPLIVAVDSQGPYVIEGGHRYDALKILRARAFPALVALELAQDGKPAA